MNAYFSLPFTIEALSWKIKIKKNVENTKSHLDISNTDLVHTYFLIIMNHFRLSPYGKRFSQFTDLKCKAWVLFLCFVYMWRLLSLPPFGLPLYFSLNLFTYLPLPLSYFSPFSFAALLLLTLIICLPASLTAQLIGGFYPPCPWLASPFISLSPFYPSASLSTYIYISLQFVYSPHLL